MNVESRAEFGDNPVSQFGWLDNAACARPADDPPQDFFQPIDLEEERHRAVWMAPDTLCSMPRRLQDDGGNGGVEEQLDVVSPLAAEY